MASKIFALVAVLSVALSTVEGRCVASADGKAKAIGEQVTAIASALSEAASSVNDCGGARAIAQSVAEAIATATAEAFAFATATVSSECDDESFAFTTADATAYAEAIARAFAQAFAQAETPLSESEVRSFALAVEKDVASVTTNAVAAAFGAGSVSFAGSVGKAVAEAVSVAFASALAEAYC